MQAASLVIFAHSDDDFELRKRSILETINEKLEIHFCDSRISSRLSFLQKNLNRWFIFLDSDCQPSLEILNYLVQLPLSNNQIVAGRYANPNKATYFQKVHNFIANNWLLSAYSGANQSPRILGGAFLIYADSILLKKSSSEKILFWGAEDKRLAAELLLLGYQIKIDKKFTVVHHTSRSLIHFFRRAWLQGYNDRLSQVIGEEKDNKLNAKHWLSELGLKDLWLVPAILVHFLVLQSGKLFQKIHQPNNKIKSK